MASDVGVTITHLDPFVRWTEDWKPHLRGLQFPVDIVGFAEDDFFRMAACEWLWPRQKYLVHPIIVR